MSRIADRIDTRPEQMEGIQLAFLPAEVLDNFERYAKLLEEKLARVEGQAALEILEIGKTMFKPQRT